MQDTLSKSHGYLFLMVLNLLPWKNKSKWPFLGGKDSLLNKKLLKNSIQ